MKRRSWTGDPLQLKFFLAKTYVAISKTPIEIDFTPREQYNLKQMKWIF